MKRTSSNISPNDDLEKFIADPDGESGDRLRTLAVRLKIEKKSYAEVLAAARNPESVRRLIIEAANGSGTNAQRKLGAFTDVVFLCFTQTRRTGLCKGAQSSELSASRR